MPAEMQRVVTARRELLVDGDEVLDVRNLGRDDDAVAPQADLFGPLAAEQRRLDDRFALHGGSRNRVGRGGVLVHQPGQQLFVERAPVDADAYRLAMAESNLDERGELRVALGLEADIARIDPVFGKGFGAGGMVSEELVPDVVEIADQRHSDAALGEPVADVGHRGGALVAVDGDAHQLGAGAPELGHLLDGGLDVGGVGVGHRLHDNGRAAADGHAANVHTHGLLARKNAHLLPVT
jgi:hypothetical protein